MFDELFEVEKLLSHWPVVHSYFSLLLILFHISSVSYSVLKLELRELK